MKLLSYRSNNSYNKQIVVVAMTMHVINTKETGDNTYKELPLVSKGWKLLREKDYSIQYPESWNLDRSGNMGLSFVLFSKPTHQPGQFRENLNLLIQDLTGKRMSLYKFVELSEKQLKSSLINVEILESRSMISQGKKFHKLIYTGSSDAFKLKFLQYYWIHNESAYILTLTCAIDAFDKYLEPAEKIMRSLRFEKAGSK